MSLKLFLPSGAVVGNSFAAAALAMLGTGSVAATSIQLPAPCSRKQPVTLTISTFFDRRLLRRRPRQCREAQDTDDND